MSTNNSNRPSGALQSIHNKRKRTVVTDHINDHQDSCYNFKIEKQHSANEQFIRQICKLYQEEKLCDVVFVVGNQGCRFKAHRVVLASANNFLSGLILSGMSESLKEVIELPETDPVLFKFILDYLYGVQIEVSSSSIVPLLGLANCYTMEGLRDRLAEILGSNLTISNCCSIFAAADAYDCHLLKCQAQDMIFSNFASASKTEAFYNLSQPLIEYVVGSSEILDCDEALLFEAATRWIEHRPHEREQKCLPLLSLIRFPLMDSCLLSDVIKIHPLMKGAERSNLLMEAFEHHALVACGRLEGVASARAKKRRQSCSFTRSTLLNGHNDAVSCVVSLGDWLISGSWDSSIKVWATDTWICVRTLSDHTGAIRGLCVCNEKVVSCSDDGCIKVWSPGSWTCVRSMDGHDGAANAVVSCRGRLASAGDDGTIKLWGSTSWACEVTVHHPLIPPDASILSQTVPTALAITPVGRRDDVQVPVVEVNRRGGRRPQPDEQQQPQRRRQRGENQEEGEAEVDMEGDGDNEDNEEEDEGDDDGDIPPPRVGVMSLEVFEDKLFSGGDDSFVRIWNTNNWTCECILKAHRDEIWSIKMNGSDLITGSVDGTIRVWRQRQKQHSQMMIHSSNSMMAMSTTQSSYHSSSSSSSFSGSHKGDRFSSNSQSSPQDSGMEVVTTQTAEGDYFVDVQDIPRTRSSSAEDMVARSSPMTLSTSTGLDSEWECEHTVTNDGPIYSLCCLDGKVVSAGASNKISIWRPAVERSEDWTLHRWFETEEAGIWSLTICKGRLISGGDDGTVRVWT